VDDDPSGVLYLHHCTTVTVSGVSITANAGVSGIVAVDVFATEVSSFADVKIITSCHYTNSNSSVVNGIEFQYTNGTYHMMTQTIRIKHYIYNNNGFCSSSYALFLVIVQESYGISMVIQDTNFTQMHNSSVLYFHGESCGQLINNNITFDHCIINNNIGNPFMNMFNVSIHSYGIIYGRQLQRNHT